MKTSLEPLSQSKLAGVSEKVSESAFKREINIKPTASMMVPGEPSERPKSN